MIGFKVLWIFFSITFVKSSPFISHYENDFTNVHEAKEEKHEEPDIYRLTDEVIPLSYELRIVPDLEKFTFMGKVEIAVHVKFATDQIVLHSKNLTIKSVRVIKTWSVENTYKLDEPNDLIIITTAQPLTYNTDYTVIIEFQGVLKDNMRGLYKSSYTIDGKEYWLATTQFEPTYAREAFPCFDEPKFRTPMTIYVAHFPNQIAISNMPSEVKLPADSASGGRIWEKFQQTPPMATYLVAFMVADYTPISNTENKIRVLTRKNAIKLGSYALTQSSKLYKQLEGYTGIPFKLPKLDVIAIPDFNAGAMENWGMTTYRERYVIADESKSSEQHKTVVTEVISHEFSHQWFGDLVTPSWWDYLWLNEGFATYFENFAAAGVEPSWKLDQIFVVETAQPALWNEITTQRAMTSPVKKFSQIRGAFDVISYDKAGSVIRMFEHMVSPNTFRNALNSYLKDGQVNHDGTVVPQVLFDAFDKQVDHDSSNFPPHITATKIMKGWTENIGFPLITVSRCYHHGEVTVKQTTYKSPRAPKPLPDQQWIVPLTYTTKSQLQFSNTKPKYWSFADKPTEFSERFSNSDWVLLNLQQSGYYRVNYDTRNWHLLIDQLREEPEKIHVLNRAQLIDDVTALADDEKLSHFISLSLLQYLTKETDMIAWYSAIRSLRRMKTELEGTTQFLFIKDYIKKLLETPYQKFAFEIKSTDSHETKIVKPMFLSLACEVGIEDCVQKSLEEYKKNENDLSKIQSDLKKVVFCNALRSSQDQLSVFNNLWNTYNKTDISFEKNEILMSFSCATNEDITKKILSKLIDPKNKEIRKQDNHYVLRSNPGQIPATTATIKFVMDKLDTDDQDALQFLSSLLNSIKIRTEEQLKLVKELETKCSTLDAKKYGEIIKEIQHLNTSGTQSIKNNNEKMEKIKSEFLSSDDKPRTEKPHPDKPPQPTSGASFLVAKSWWHLVIACFVFCYGIPVLRTQS